MFWKKQEADEKLSSTSKEAAPKPEIHLKFSSATEASIDHPDKNEDAFGFGDGWVAVLDGVGGLKGGAEASRVALDSLTTSLIGKDVLGYSAVEEKVYQAVQRANTKILESLDEGRTTVVIGRTFEKDGKKNIFIANVGDSRAYLLRGGKFKRITEDDNIFDRSLTAKFDSVESADELTMEELLKFKDRNIITSSIGSREAPGINPYVCDLRNEDIFLFTTDGVNDNLTSDEIHEILQARGDIAQNLVDRAKTKSMRGLYRSKLDDITAVVMRVSSGEGEETQ